MEAINLVCFKCKHFRRFTGDGGCDAFPKGIPNEITSGDNKHKEPLKGQENDIVFEPIKET
jgi:hypothetical protein